MERFDVAVIGCGGVGSAALAYLAERGLHAIGLDRFRPPHDRGSSHGHTRAIRQAYFEHPMYVPLLRRAYALWESLEQACNRRLFHVVGLLEAGPSDGLVVPGVLASAAEHNLPVQTWTVEEAAKLVPGIQLDESMQVVFEENAGYLLVEDCIHAYLGAAKNHGGSLRLADVHGINVRSNSVEIFTDRGKLEVGAAVVTVGAWCRDLVLNATEQSMELPLEVVRKHLHWRPTLDAMYGADQGFPVFFVEEPGEEGSDQTTDASGNQPTDGPLVGGNTRFFYGFPKLDMRGLKVAEHSDGALVEDPLTCERGPEREDTLRVEDFIRRRLAGVAPDGGEHASCFYTMTPDGHFIVDQLPNAGHVAFAAGLSGHGFKFASVLGETLSQLALGESPTCDIDFLRASRFMES